MNKITPNELAIGVFDSGMGGLTVLRALRAHLPHESFIYLGDTARLPYGTKSVQTIQHYAVQMARILVEQRIKALIIACNTATTAALTHLQELLPNIPVLGVVEPGANAAVNATQNQRIVVFATETTIKSNAYQHLIRQKLPHVTLFPRACSLLVALAEEGMVDNVIAETVVQHYLSGITHEDTLLLGCTHFPVFKPLLERLLPPEVHIVDSALATAIALKERLAMDELLNDQKHQGKIRYLVTDSVERFQHVGQVFLGHPLESTDVELIDGC